MPFLIQCPGCTRTLRLQDDLIGAQVRCPSCGHEFAARAPESPETGIRATQGAPAPTAGPSPIREGEPPPVPRPPRYDDYQDDDDFGEPMYRRRGYNREAALQRVSGPATSLIVVAIIGIVLSVVGMGLNLGGAGLNAGRNNQMIVNAASGTISSAFHIAVSVVILIGAMKMKNLENIGLAKAAAILAMIPCISPCCLLGLPFGWWALSALGDPNVVAAFSFRPPTGDRTYD